MTTSTGAPDHRARIAISWTIVGIPLLYGIFNAVKAAMLLAAG